MGNLSSKSKGKIQDSTIKPSKHSTPVSAFRETPQHAPVSTKNHNWRDKTVPPTQDARRAADTVVHKQSTDDIVSGGTTSHEEAGLTEIPNGGCAIEYRRVKQSTYSSQVSSESDEDTLRLLCRNLEYETSMQAEQITKLKEDVQKIRHEKEELLIRLSDYTSKHLADNNPNITDLADPNRPTILAEIFSELYDNAWTDAFECLSKEMKSDEKAIKKLLRVLETVYECCKTEASRQLELAAVSIYGLTKIKADEEPVKRSLKEFKDERKRNYKSFIPDLLKKIDESEVVYPSVIRDLPSVKTFLEQSLDICWLMCIQDPPVVLMFSGKQGTSFDGQLFTTYTTEGRKVKFIVWPSILLYNDGPILRKGVAQGKKKKKRSAKLGSKGHTNTESRDYHIDNTNDGNTEQFKDINNPSILREPFSDQFLVPERRQDRTISKDPNSVRNNSRVIESEDCQTNSEFNVSVGGGSKILESTECELDRKKYSVDSSRSTSLIENVSAQALNARRFQNMNVVSIGSTEEFDQFL